MRPILQVIAVVCLFLTSCGTGGGSSSTPIAGANVPPELLACRVRVDDPFRFAEIALRDSRNLGARRVADRSGVERHARLHPDGNRVVFARERTKDSASSREIFVSSLDGSFAELRVTNNTSLDDDPSWSPDGSRILFTTDRFGIVGLWTMDADGGNAEAFVVPPSGTTDGEADWSGATNRIVWSRRSPDGRHVLWIANDNGVGAQLLTDGGAIVGDGAGDRSPSFSPDGSSIVFVRRSTQERASLASCEASTGATTVLFTPVGDVDTPRFAPSMDRIFFGLAEPDAGRTALRLATIALDGSAPTLIWPDERWQLIGLDLLPSLPAAPTMLKAPELLDVENAELQLAAGTAAFGGRAQLKSLDGDELLVRTTSFELREIAGINCKFDVPVIEPEHVVRLRIRAVARVSRVDGDAVLRMSFYNPVDERFDTAVEIEPTTTGAQEMTFTSSSLRHLTREKQLRVTVGADLPNGDTAELNVDLVEIELVAIVPPVAPATLPK